MRKTVNREHIEGWVYENNLAIKQVKSEKKADGTPNPNFGKDYIGGSLSIQTDDAGMNIVTVKFTYVTPLTSKGTKNATFDVLKNIIESDKTVMTVGKDAAQMVKIDTALGLDEFYSSRSGQEELVSAKKNDGGFVSFTSKLTSEDKRSTFETDMLINGTQLVEADGEKVTEDYLKVKGAVFNFRNELLPVEFVVKSAGGIKYFESLEASASNPVFTKVWGNIVSLETTDVRVEESAFGEPIQKEFVKTLRQWEIIGAAQETYELGDSENGITLDELKELMSKREMYLADVKKRADEYAASKQAGGNTVNAFSTNPASSGVTAAQGGFNF